MGALAILLALQGAATALGFVFLWRRLRANERETARLRAMLDPTGDNVSPVEDGQLGRVLRLPVSAGPAPSPTTPNTSHGLVGGVALAAAAALPAMGFLFDIDHGWIVAIGCLVGACMMVVSLAKPWAAAAWASVATVGVWSVLGVAVGADLVPAAGALAGAGLTGVIYARLRALAPGAAMTLTAAAALLYWCAQNGAISIYGGALAFLVVAAAVGGAHLKAEPIHLGAFALALAGLFVLSGQDVAAVWFTPIAAWVGALFFAIAAVRVPVAGARAATLAGTGVLAPLLAAGLLHRANHALAASWAAGAAFLLIAACASLLIAATLRRHRPKKLGLTHWLLGLGAFTAYAIGIGHVLNDAFASAAFAALVVALVAADEHWPMALWRLLASLGALFAVAHGIETVRSTLAELSHSSPLFTVFVGPVAAAFLLALAYRMASRTATPKPLTAITFEVAALVLAVLAAHALLRLLFSSGAPVLTPVGFFEACAHLSVWLVAALLVARSDHPVRTTTALILATAAGASTAVLGLFWFTPYWAERAATSGVPPALGFFLVSACFWAHWTLWRGRAEETPTRASLATAALFMACGAVLWLVGVSAADWLKALLSGLAFTLAIAINFAPGVTAGVYEMQRFRRSATVR